MPENSIRRQMLDELRTLNANVKCLIGVMQEIDLRVGTVSHNTINTDHGFGQVVDAVGEVRDKLPANA